MALQMAVEKGGVMIEPLKNELWQKEGKILVKNKECFTLTQQYYHLNKNSN